MNIIITGASKGIGFEAAKILAVQHRVLALSRNTDALKKLQSENKNILVFGCDISDKKQIAELTAYTKKNFNKADVLINNAGHLLKNSFEKISEAEMKKIFDTNFFGAVYLIQALLPHFEKSKKAHILNIGSMGGFQGSAKFPGLSLYSSSKAALACLTECLAEEFKEKKISVNCLALGAAQTEMFSKAFPGYKAPLSAKEMAQFIADFAVSGNKYFNGKVLPVSLSTP